MSNMLQTVIPKSDQLNADSLIGGKVLTIKVTKVTLVNGDQPVAINYEGDDEKPYKPCKSMRRVLIHAWGGDGAQYVGRSMTLYCDPAVKFGGADVGGIRISHLSNIERDMTVALTATRANRKPFTVKPLATQAIDHILENLKQAARTNAINGTTALQTWWGTLPKDSQAKLKSFMDEYKKIAAENDTKSETKKEIAP